MASRARTHLLNASIVPVFVTVMALALGGPAHAGGVPAGTTPPGGAPAVATATLSIQDGIDAYRAGAPLHALDVFVHLARVRPQSALPVIWAGVAAAAAGQIHAATVYFHEGLRRPHSVVQERLTQAWLRYLGKPGEAPSVLLGPPSERTAKVITSMAHATDSDLTWVQSAWIGDHVVTAARLFGLDPYLLASVVYIESGFNQASISPAGALGLGQLTPETAAAAGVDPRDPWGNLMGSAMTLRGTFLAFGDWHLALAAYNAGPGAVRRYRGIPPYAETRSYVRSVLSTYRKIHRGG